MKKDLLAYLACPVCKGKLELTVDIENEREVIAGYLFCLQCHVRYPIVDTVPNLLPPALHNS